MTGEDLAKRLEADAVLICDLRARIAELELCVRDVAEALGEFSDFVINRYSTRSVGRSYTIKFSRAAASEVLEKHTKTIESVRGKG